MLSWLLLVKNALNWYNDTAVRRGGGRMSYRIAVCDDCAADRSYVQTVVQEWAENEKIDTQLEYFPSAEAFLFCYAEDKNWDILLLDIEMGQMDGVSMAKAVRKENETVQIIFISGYSEYIAEGYDVAALHYLLKPIQPEKLKQVLERAVQKLKKNENAITVECSGEMIRIPLYEIRYLDVQRNYVTLHGKQDYTVKRTLAEFEAELDERFFRAGRSCILNLTIIKKVTKSEVFLSDGTVLPLPRGQYEALNRAIISRL